MTKTEIEQAALELPISERETLALRLVASLPVEPILDDAEIQLLRQRREEALNAPGIGKTIQELARLRSSRT